MINQEMKSIVTSAVKKYSCLAIEVAKQIAENAETGYKEYKTSKLVKDWFTHYEIPFSDNLGITGVRANLNFSDGPNIAMLGELDSLVVPSHPDARSETSAVHACGHHIQIGALLAVACALNEPEVRKMMTGNVSMIAVPAEEFIEIGFRQALKDSNAIEFFGGKQELVKLGVFDDVDIALLTHATGDTINDRPIMVGGRSNGHLAKEVRYIGKSAHAGAAPHQGINALNAANIALAAINANRETFLDSDSIRVHPIITKGGDVVNAVPEEVRIEMYVRGRNIDAILDANRKVDNSLKAGAMALGATVEIRTIPGYLPLEPDFKLSSIFKENAIDYLGTENVGVVPPNSLNNSGSTDMGDLSWMMPTIQPYTHGVSGQIHGDDFEINDWDSAITTPAAISAITIVDLLSNNGGKAKEIMKNFKPRFLKEEYLSMLRSINKFESFQG